MDPGGPGSYQNGFRRSRSPSVIRLMRKARSAVILMIEDDPNDVFLMKRALERAGLDFPVRSVPDGEEAVAYLEGSGRYADRDSHPVPCMVLLDFKLPRRNGLEVLRWLRARKDLEDLPVLMISSSTRPEDKKAAIDNGIEAYRVKPVSFEEMIRLATEIRDRAREHCEDATPCPPEPGRE